MCSARCDDVAYDVHVGDPFGFELYLMLGSACVYVDFAERYRTACRDRGIDPLLWSRPGDR